MFGISRQISPTLLLAMLLLFFSLTAESGRCPKCHKNMYPGKNGEQCENGCGQESKNDADCISLSQQLVDRLEKHLSGPQSIDKGVTKTIQKLAAKFHCLDKKPPSPGQRSEEVRQILQIFQASEEMMQSVFSQPDWQNFSSRSRGVSIAPILSQEALTEVFTLFEAVYADHHLSIGAFQTALIMVLVLQQERYGDVAAAESTLARNSLDLQSILLYWLMMTEESIKASQNLVLAMLEELSEVLPNQSDADLNTKQSQIAAWKTYDVTKSDMVDHFLADSHSNYHIFTLKAPRFVSLGFRAASGDTQSIFLLSPMIRISVNTNDLGQLIGQLQNSLNSATVTDILYDTTVSLWRGLQSLLSVNADKKLNLGMMAFLLTVACYKQK